MYRAGSWTLLILVGPFQLRVLCGSVADTETALCCDISHVSPALPGALGSTHGFIPGAGGPLPRDKSRGSVSLPRGPFPGWRSCPAASVTAATPRTRAMPVPPPPSHAAGAAVTSRGARGVCVSPLPARGRSCRDVTKCPGACVYVRVSVCPCPFPLPSLPARGGGPLRRHGPLPASAPARASRRPPPPRARARARRDVTGGH